MRITPTLSFLLLWRVLYDLVRVLVGGSDHEFAHRRTVDHKGAVVAAVACGLDFVLWLVLTGDGVLRVAIIGIATELVLVVLAYLGVDSVVGWALRTTLRQVRALGTMTSKALPLLLLFTTFGFFTTEVWQVAGSLSRQRLWLVIGLFVLVGVLYMFSVLSDELRAFGSHACDPIEPDWWHATPFDEPAGTAERIPLRRPEKANMVAVLMLAQLVQVLVFSVLMFVFFIVFGLVSLRADVMAQWVGHAPTVGSLVGVWLAGARRTASGVDVPRRVLRHVLRHHHHHRHRLLLPRRLPGPAGRPPGGKPCGTGDLPAFTQTGDEFPSCP